MATVVEGNPKAPFSIATTPKCRGEHSGMHHFTLDLYFIMLSVKQGGIKYHFLSLVWLHLGLNPSILYHWQTQLSQLPGCTSTTTVLMQGCLVWFGLVWFYGISTILGYLMPDLSLPLSLSLSLYIYIYINSSITNNSV